MRRGSIWALAVAAIGLAAPSAVVGLLASRPRLATLVFGPNDSPPRLPSDLGLAFEDVDYGRGRGWWIPSPEDGGLAAVVAHGFDPSDDPRSLDPAPRLDVAASLHRMGCASLVINLGYAGGSRPHTGGVAEAADIVAAVNWARGHSGRDVGLIGFSAGGHACLAASVNASPAFIVTDSSFVDFGEVVVRQAVGALGIPSGLVAAAPTAMRFISGEAPVDLATVALSSSTPTLHIHGSADTALDPTELERLAALTGGTTLLVPDAEHVESHRVDPAAYETALRTLLAAAKRH